jgi:hypothetical protein
MELGLFWGGVSMAYVTIGLVVYLAALTGPVRKYLRANEIHLRRRNIPKILLVVLGTTLFTLLFWEIVIMVYLAWVGSKRSGDRQN